MVALVQQDMVQEVLAKVKVGALQVETVQPGVENAWSQRLNLRCNKLLFKFCKVGRC